MNNSTLVIIDGHALIYRAFHAFPPLSTKTGELVNAVYGFTRILLTVIKESQPEFIAVTFDHPSPTFRHKQFEDYKAHRPPMPDELKSQIKRVKEMVAALNIPQFELPGYEADDIIGTMCELAKKQVKKIIIVTGDKDTLQLVDETVSVWLPVRGGARNAQKNGTSVVGEVLDRTGVKNKLGVYPEQVVDYKALVGDPSDNIPGVAGIGEKTAVRLITEFGSLGAVEAAVKKITTNELEKRAGNELAAKSAGQSTATEGALTPTITKKIASDLANLTLSQSLATIDRQVPFEFKLEACRVMTYDKETTVALMQQLDFNSLIKLLPNDEFEAGVQAALF